MYDGGVLQALHSSGRGMREKAKEPRRIATMVDECEIRYMLPLAPM